MLKAAVFEDFKGATTLLLWGDGEGMASLYRALNALCAGNGNDFAIDGPAGGVIIAQGESSRLTREERRLRWHCPRETVELAAGLVEPLISAAGHQFLDVSGLAEQVVIARDEYPADLR